jgi:hypothetical protein
MVLQIVNGTLPLIGLQLRTPLQLQDAISVNQDITVSQQDLQLMPTHLLLSQQPLHSLNQLPVQEQQLVF